MLFFNPWAYYQIHEPDKIPNLNPQDDDEARGCLVCDAGTPNYKSIRCDVRYNRACPCKYNQCLKYK